MKTEITKRSINVVTFVGLLTAFIAVALVRYAAAEGEPAFLTAPRAAMQSPSGTQTPVWLLPRRASPPSTTHSTNRASTR